MDDDDAVELPSSSPTARKGPNEEVPGDDLSSRNYFNTPSINYPHAPSASLNQNFPPPPRYSGDGFDFRRPIMSRPQQSHTDIIDLTIDSDTPTRPSLSGPRRQATVPRPYEVIDLDDGSDDADDPGRADESPEVEVLYSQPRPGAPPRRSQSTINIRDRVTIQPPPPPQASDIHLVEEFQEQARRHEQERQAQQLTRGTFDNIFGNMPAFWRFTGLNVNNAIGNITGMVNQTLFNAEQEFGAFAGANFQTPDLDFQTIGFDLGQPDRPPARAPPRYNAPQPVLEGFTRSPQEDDTPICPNCDSELGQGESEEKRQIWFVRSCGHVYCGECAKNRKKKNAKNGTTKTFSKCVVEGCGNTKLTGNKTMIMIYHA